jgi:hypothetical protein
LSSQAVVRVAAHEEAAAVRVAIGLARYLLPPEVLLPSQLAAVAQARPMPRERTAMTLFFPRSLQRAAALAGRRVQAAFLARLVAPVVAAQMSIPAALERADRVTAAHKAITLARSKVVAVVVRVRAARRVPAADKVVTALRRLMDRHMRAAVVAAALALRRQVVRVAAV